MELSQVAKARKKGRGAQARAQGIANANPGVSAEDLSRRVHIIPTGHVVEPPSPSGGGNPPVRGRGGKAAVGLGILAAGGGGAYLYQRRRAEKSLSSMQGDRSPMMMRST